MDEANTLAYYYTAIIMAVKGFIVQAPGDIFLLCTTLSLNPGACNIKLLRQLLLPYPNKLVCLPLALTSILV